MSMVLETRCVSDHNIDAIKRTPVLVWQLVAADDPEFVDDMIAESAGIENKKVGFFSKFLGKSKKDETLSAPMFARLEFTEAETCSEYYDKAWHGIHYCLTQTAWEGTPPLNFIVNGGETLGEVDVGYGPARAYRCADARIIYENLNLISESDLKGRYNPQDMKKLEIYPDIWAREDEDNFDYIREYFIVMKKFLKYCVDHDLGFIIYIT